MRCPIPPLPLIGAVGRGKSLRAFIPRRPRYDVAPTAVTLSSEKFAPGLAGSTSAKTSWKYRHPFQYRQRVTKRSAFHI